MIPIEHAAWASAAAAAVASGTQAPRVDNVVSGYVDFQTVWQQDLSGSDISSLQPAIAARILVKNVGGSGGDLRFRDRIRYYHRSQPAGTPLGGAAVMAAFWAGTVPILLAVGFGAQAAAIPFRRHAPLLTAVLLVVIGVVAIVRRPDTTLSIFSRIQAKSAGTVEQVNDLDSGEMPCCEEE